MSSLHVEIEGLVPEPDADVDGFIVQWGRYSWHGGRRCVSFTRQLAASGGGDPQPGYWQVDLALVFDDAARLAVLGSGHESDTGFFFRPVGPQRDAAIVEAGRYPQLHAALTARPAHSELSFGRVS